MPQTAAAGLRARPKLRRPHRQVRQLLNGRNVLILYAMAPVVVYTCIMWLFPVGYGMVMSTFAWNPMSLRGSPFTGLTNYRRAFSDPIVATAIWNSAKYALFTVGLGAPLALLVALLLNSLRRGRGLFRLIFFLPVVTSMIAAGIIFKYLYQPRLGILNGILMAIRSLFGLRFALPRYLQDPRTALFCISLMTVWKELGFNAVIFMAGLSGISPEHYEAARIDGAGRWALFRHITLPLLQPTVVLVLVTGISSAMQAFSEMYVMAEGSGTGARLGGPVNSTLTIVLELYQRAFRLFEFGYASTLAIIIFAIIATLSLVQLRLGRMRWEY